MLSIAFPDGKCIAIRQFFCKHNSFAEGRKRSDHIENEGNWADMNQRFFSLADSDLKLDKEKMYDLLY